MSGYIQYTVTNPIYDDEAEAPDEQTALLVTP